MWTSWLNAPWYRRLQPWDIEVGAAFDIDRRKSGENSQEALFAKPNCTKMIYPNSTILMLSCPWRGVGWSFSTYEDYPEEPHLLVANEKPCQCGKGSQRVWGGDPSQLSSCGFRTEPSVLCRGCLNAGWAWSTACPVFIVSDQKWAKRFEDKRIPAVGDDFKIPDGRDHHHRGKKPDSPPGG